VVRALVVAQHVLTALIFLLILSPSLISRSIKPHDKLVACHRTLRRRAG
jgi:hypothetical protein